MQIRQAWDAEMGTPWAAMASASASIVQRVAPAGGSSVTSFTSKQHVVVVIDARTTRAILVIEPGQAELLIALPPDADLVVVQIDGLADVAVGPTVGHQQDHRARLDTRASMVFDRTHASSSARSPRRSFNGGSRIPP